MIEINPSSMQELIISSNLSASFVHFYAVANRRCTNICSFTSKFKQNETMRQKTCRRGRKQEVTHWSRWCRTI